jgi:AcrR family transcriptional regulator
VAATIPERSNRQREILGTARELLARDGGEALSLGALAKAVGIKPPSLYKHFASRADIEAALIAEGLQELADALEAAGGDLHALGAAFRRYALSNRELFRLMTAGPLPRARLPAGLEARIALPFQKALPDPHMARAVAAFAHGMVALEIAERFPPWSKLEKSWARALDAFAAARPPG